MDVQKERMGEGIKARRKTSLYVPSRVWFGVGLGLVGWFRVGSGLAYGGLRVGIGVRVDLGLGLG